MVTSPVGREQYRHTDQLCFTDDAGDGVQLWEKALEERDLLLGFRVSPFGKVDVGGKDILRLHTQVHPGQREEASCDQARTVSKMSDRATCPTTRPERKRLCWNTAPTFTPVLANFLCRSPRMMWNAGAMPHNTVATREIPIANNSTGRLSTISDSMGRMDCRGRSMIPFIPT